MADQCTKNGYVGYEGMGKPIPLLHCIAACKVCVQYGMDEKTADDIVMKMVELLECNKPHEAVVLARGTETGFTLTKVYQLIHILMTGENIQL